MKYRKAMQIVSVSFIALGLAGVGGATDLCTSPNNSLAVLVLGMAIAVMVLRKEKRLCHRPKLQSQITQ
jgi:hypothetical protein